MTYTFCKQSSCYQRLKQMHPEILRHYGNHQSVHTQTEKVYYNNIYTIILYVNSTVQKLDTMWYHLMSPKLFLQHANNPKHTARVTENCQHQQEHIVLLQLVTLGLHEEKEATETALKFTEELWLWCFLKHLKQSTCQVPQFLKLSARISRKTGAVHG